MITKRQQQILNLIISLYTQTHKAVGSKALMTSISASSATIRNDMKTLETLGFIQKEHTSTAACASMMTTSAHAHSTRCDTRGAAAAAAGRAIAPIQRGVSPECDVLLLSLTTQVDPAPSS